MPAFDAYVVVDWSAANTPRLGRDSIWCAAIGPAVGSDGGLADEGRLELVNLRTRAAAEAWLIDRLQTWTGRRVLVGFDFSFGYPAGFATVLGLESAGRAPWEATWAHLAGRIVDDDRNRNNRFEVADGANRAVGPSSGPFWGCPSAAASRHLTSTKPTDGFAAAGVDEYRCTERVMRAAGHRVFSGWQLLGVGTVGSQTLTGIPVLERLRHASELSDRVRVWPFEFTDERAPGPGLNLGCELADPIVFAEVWPGSIPLDASVHPVRDAAQVLGLSRHLAARDRADELAPWFVLDLSSAVRSAVFDEEGWILGCPTPTATAGGTWSPSAALPLPAVRLT